MIGCLFHALCFAFSLIIVGRLASGQDQKQQSGGAIDHPPVFSPWVDDIRLLSFASGTNNGNLYLFRYRIPIIPYFAARKDAIVQEIKELPSSVYVIAVFEVARRPGESLEAASQRLLNSLTRIDSSFNEQDLRIHPTLDADVTVTIEVFKDLFRKQLNVHNFSYLALRRYRDQWRKEISVPEQKCDSITRAIDSKFGFVDDYHAEVWELRNRHWTQRNHRRKEDFPKW
jgi:hypothetical protein